MDKFAVIGATSKLSSSTLSGSGIAGNYSTSAIIGSQLSPSDTPVELEAGEAQKKRVDAVLHTDGSNAANPNHDGLMEYGLSEYYFYGTITEAIIHRYLDKSLLVLGLASWYYLVVDSQGNYVGNGAASYPSDYDPYSSLNSQRLYDPAYDHGKLLQMIVDTGAKHVWDLMSFWGGPSTTENLFYLLNTLKHDIEFIHAHDSEVICGASICEFGSIDGFDGLQSDGTYKLGVLLPPAWMVDLFYPPSSSPRPAKYSEYFYYADMVLDPSKCTAAKTDFTPCHFDFSKQETQLWYFYLATLYIDYGVEAIHFGDLFDGAKVDKANGWPLLWRLVGLIREYAKTHSRRGVVLLDAHMMYKIANGYYYDPNPSAPLPDSVRQLIFDFYSLGTFYTRNDHSNCHDGGLENSDYPVILEGGNGLLHHSPGGLHPQGWYCKNTPALSRFDTSGIYDGAGCGFHDEADPQGPNDYGFDNQTWFCMHNSDLKRLILAYTYYKIKCLDPNCHFGMPARVHYHESSTDGGKDYNAFSVTTMIADLWSNRYVGPNGWVFHNFTYEKVISNPLNAASGLTIVGSDKVFYIGTDGWIYGYVLYHGAWRPVCPTALANKSGQTKAKSDLVASPDGKRLLYIGVDGYIYGFDMFFSAFDYHYFPFLVEDMKHQNIKAKCCLIYPMNDRIYYIADQPWAGGNVHGFQLDDVWQTVSPSFSSQNLTSISTTYQQQAQRGLTYDYHPTNSRLFYVGTNGLIYYFLVETKINYLHFEYAGNYALYDNHLVVQGNIAIHENRIYFIGKRTNNGILEVFCTFDDIGLNFSVYSVSFAAHWFFGAPIYDQISPDDTGLISISPDGNTIVYTGIKRDSSFSFWGGSTSSDHYYLCYFSKVAVFSFAYKNMNSNWPGKLNSLQFNGNNEVFFIDSTQNTVQEFRFEEDYCQNSIIAAYENR